MGAPRWPPTPPSFGPPRRSRGGPLSTWGPRHGPQSPIVRTAPAKPWRSSIYMGAPTWPPIPHRSDRPGKAVAVLYSRLTSGCSEQAAVLWHHAAILHHADPRASERFRRAVVADAELKPHHRRLPRQPHDLRRVTRQELWAAEDLDDVGGLAQVGQRGGDRLAEDALVGPRRVDRQHTVPAGLQLRGHVARRLRR